MGGAGETPTARIVGEAWAPLSVVDAQGRKLEFRRPGALDRLRLFKALGPVLSSNDRYVSYAMLAFCVSAIDGVPQPQPANEGWHELTGTVQAGGMALRPKGPAIQDAAMRKGRTRFQQPRAARRGQLHR